MKKHLVYYFLFLLLILGFTGSSQDCLPPFYKEVQIFKAMDSIRFPAPNQILLAGSSSFTLWTNATKQLSGFPILNRAFGGSTLADQIYYRNDIFYTYRPRQVVLYCGENDFAYQDTLAVETVVARFKQLLKLIRAKYPAVPVVYVSMKPSPARRQLISKFKTANNEIKNYIKKQPLVTFADVFTPMMKNSMPDASLFGPDSLHMNENGYRLWQNILKPLLKK